MGMGFAFLALLLMEIGQPALLYLVPCSLLPVLLLAYCRGHLRALWRGYVPLDCVRALVRPILVSLHWIMHSTRVHRYCYSRVSLQWVQINVALSCAQYPDLFPSPAVPAVAEGLLYGPTPTTDGRAPAPTTYSAGIPATHSSDIFVRDSLPSTVLKADS